MITHHASGELIGILLAQSSDWFTLLIHCEMEGPMLPRARWVSLDALRSRALLRFISSSKINTSFSRSLTGAKPTPLPGLVIQARVHGQGESGQAEKRMCHWRRGARLVGQS